MIARLYSNENFPLPVVEECRGDYRDEMETPNPLGSIPFQ